MAMRFCDSFNHYASGDIALKWVTTHSFNTPTIVSGRNGTALRLTGAFFSDSYVLKVIDNQATWIIGVAINLTSTSVNQGLLALWDSTTRQCGVFISNTSHLCIEKNGTTLATSSGTWTNGWNYVELKVFFNGGSGTVDVRVNGASFVTYSGNVSQSGNNRANGIALGDWIQANGQGATLWDDLYVNDGTGSVNNDFLGDVVVEALYPSGTGSYSQFTPTGASPNYNAVNNSTPDGDTTYNVDGTTSDRDSFTFTDFSQGVITVYGVQTILDVKKVGSGTRALGPFFRASTTNYDQTGQTISGSYAFYVTMNETNPATSSLWTESEVNAIEAGYRITV